MARGSFFFFFFYSDAILVLPRSFFITANEAPQGQKIKENIKNKLNTRCSYKEVRVATGAPLDPLERA